MQKQTAATVAWVLALIFLVAGIFIAVTGVNQFMATGHLRETKATITDVAERRVADAKGREQIEYDVTVEYVLDGQTVTARMDPPPRTFAQGMELTVAYDPADPTQATLPGAQTAILMLGMGVMGAFSGVYIIVQRLRARSKAD